MSVNEKVLLEVRLFFHLGLLNKDDTFIEKLGKTIFIQNRLTKQILFGEHSGSTPIKIAVAEGPTHLS